jgi:hypothetical protein
MKLVVPIIEAGWIDEIRRTIMLKWLLGRDEYVKLLGYISYLCRYKKHLMAQLTVDLLELMKKPLAHYHLAARRRCGKPLPGKIDRLRFFVARQRRF